MKLCSLSTCNQKHYANSLCHKHYMQEYRRRRPTYTQGAEDGRTQILDAINAALEPHDGSAYIHSHTLYIEIQGNTLQAPISYKA